MGLRLKKITQTLEPCTKTIREYKFPRASDQYEYSPEHSYSSLQGDVYDLNSQLKYPHRRVLSQAVLQRGKSKENKLSSLSPMKLESVTGIKMAAKLSPHKFFLLNQIRKQNQVPSKLQHSQLVFNKGTKKPHRMHTETIENITKYRLG